MRLRITRLFAILNPGGGAGAPTVEIEIVSRSGAFIISRAGDYIIAR